MSSAAEGGDAVEPSGPNSIADMTAFQRDILRVLDLENHQKGLSIKEKLSDYYGTEVNHGRLYPNLDDLVDAGFIDKSERDARTNDYALTDAGEKALSDRDAWEWGDA